MDWTSAMLGLVGGLLIGTASVLMLWLNGRIAGISGITGGLLSPLEGDISWRVMFVVGMAIGGVILTAVYPTAFPTEMSTNTAGLIASGLLVGFGTRLGSGCTSGHGVCGMPRMSARSFTATGTFMLAGAVTVYVMRHVIA